MKTRLKLRRRMWHKVGILRSLPKLRISIHVLELEKGRNVRGYKKPEERKCFNCPDSVEDERHFLTKCTLYSKFREEVRIQFASIDSKLGILQEDQLFLLLIGPRCKLKKIVAKLKHVKAWLESIYSYFSVILYSKLAKISVGT